MDKLKMHSLNKVNENIKKIGTQFPNCITERLNQQGEVEYAIDFDILKQELSSVIVTGRDERYQFTWPDKKESILLANAPIAKTLRPCREESVDFDDTQNLYIEGDNLEVLKLLQETYLGKVKMIYIDPPYNTGHDFVYEDDFAQNTSEYLENSGQFDDEGNRLVKNLDTNGRFHTDWLNMIYPRLKLARDLLTDDGVIFISIDDNEHENLKKICDEIFGAQNFAACIPWQSRLSIQNDTDFSINHEYVLVYAKNRRFENRRLKKNNETIWYQKNSFVFRPLPLDKSKFDNPDNDARGPWKADPFDAPNVRPNLTYPIINPNTGEQHLPPAGRHWRISPEKFSSALADGRIIFGKLGTGRPQMKSFYDEKKDFGSIDNSWFSGEKIGTSTTATKELQMLFKKIPFDTPKPISFLTKLMILGFLEDNDIILDFFSGSASTAHAMMQLNAEDGGNRKFIMVQLPEPTDEKSEAYKAGYKNICEIGKERIRRAGNKIAKENPQAKFDKGFRVLKCDSTNMKEVYYNPAEYNADLLDVLIDNIKADRTPEDLLFQVMLDLGVLLSSDIKQTTIAGKTVFNVADSFLMACFDTDINEEIITVIAKQKPYYFVMRDSSMANDSVATNFQQIFNTYSPETKKKVL
ncbi:site-specific DNA-methyltransferase [Snodgrassella sp. ESL0324]|uniref:site-specific DNA-methyltransferase n=1 Tax=Snodgrassella sp. ESL0324 TaxID=2705033 RepID=UPI001582D1AC|nr:site-specific DNA-methyltransferase [Snodgrassella sp. ESL0324]